MISEMNQGYINTKMPIRVSLHCIEASNLPDNSDSSAMLKEFRNLKSSVEELRYNND